MSDKTLLFSTRDLRIPFEYKDNYKDAINSLGGNSGNLLFFNAIQYFLEQAKTEFDVNCSLSNFFTKEANEKYSCFIVSCANWINSNSKNLLINLANDLKNITKPVFFIGLGAQSNTLNNYNFIQPIQNELSVFIKAVLDTGGGFGLRGEYTANLFRSLGFNEGYSVIGCPSLYQNGNKIEISNTKVEYEDFKPLFNGKMYLKQESAEIYKFHKDSEYVCQDDLFKFLFYPKELTKFEKRSILAFSDEVINLLITKRLQLFPELTQWISYLNSKGFNFLLGNRFHGNVVGILNEIPSLIHIFDSRTSELADFFRIPTVHDFNLSNSKTVYDLYCNTDYTSFNENFHNRFEDFNKFVSKNNLPLSVPKEKNNSFIDSTFQMPDYKPSVLDELLTEYINFKPTKIISRFLNKRKQFIVKKRDLLF